ncbi:DUF2334 domain-containing protein [Corynebacterium guangdongense]|uniref:Deacetylase n=1 Tax=Corynebacterium guangdongense TaxID=1783348 RepID=A0ABU1ZZF2_9CORY|nr:DUF2334 domain-containing protein [Corynebacterium guangdongense]MDR7330235.1 putative deacetylase [Corynebacterium guangdongense]WJZ18793.1 hypothetical protein CGUA_11280 [Corynebacterium guangdongense]
MPGHLLVSISSIFSETRPQVADVISRLEDQGVAVTLLVAPHIGDWHLAKDDETRAWLETRRDEGHPLVLNGFDQAVQGRRAEFATLDSHEARLRLKGATRQMRKMGFDSPIFAPPRWRLSPGTLEVLPEFGFDVACSSTGLHDIGNRATVPGRNLSIGEGFGASKWWRTAVVKAAERGAAKGHLVRLSASGRNLNDAKTVKDFLTAVRAATEAGAVPSDYCAFSRQLLER